jgi:methylated-DNA-[protein]-cysteine S-methyltransferase
VNPAYQASVKTRFAHLALVLDKDELVAIDFIAASASEIRPETEQAKKVVQQIRAYCQRSAHSFEVKLRLQGTAFQQSVWCELQKIPFGKVKTYGELAKILNTSARAVGNACRRNPVPLIVPCHRIVAATGIGGYAGRTSGDVHNIKRELLQHEGLATV